MDLVATEQDAGTSGQTRLTPAVIVSAAREIAVAEGTSQLSLRRLGRTLSVDHTALYRHFRSKDDLLDAVADSILSSPSKVPTDQPWQTQLRIGLRQAIDRYRIHPDLAQIVAMRPSSSVANARLMESGQQLLRRAGLSPAQAAKIISVIEAWVMAFGLFISVSLHTEAQGEGAVGEAVDDLDEVIGTAIDMFVSSLETLTERN